jgi:hypothetical protein
MPNEKIDQNVVNTLAQQLYPGRAPSTLNQQQPDSTADKVAYRCWWRYAHGHCRWCPAGTTMGTVIIIIAIAGGVMAVATAAGSRRQG